jgi:hypothetical protein
MIAHEQAVLAVHPRAREFRPVHKSLGGGIWGWVYQVPAGEGSASVVFSWVTVDGEVSQDCTKEVRRAEGNLKTYMRNRRAHKAPRIQSGHLEDMK